MSINNDDLLDLTMEEVEEFKFGAQIEEVFSPAGGDPMDTVDSLPVGEKLLTATQVVVSLEHSSVLGTARETLSSSSSWYDQVLEEEREAAAREGGQEGPWTQGLHHPSGESSQSLPMDGVELGQDQPELWEEELAREACRKAVYQEAQRIFSGRGSGLVVPPNTVELESVNALRGWFLQEEGSVWSEMDIRDKLRNLSLVPAQQAFLDNELREDQWHLPKSQEAQPHNEFIKRLRTSMAFHRQSSVLVLSVMDHVQSQAFNVLEVLRTANKGAVRPQGYRDSFHILDEPSKEMVGDINHHFSGFLFPGTEPVKPDLAGLLTNIPEEISQRILLAVEEAHVDNLARSRILDNKVRTLANSASSLINTTAEALAGYARIQSALDARQLNILRRHTGAFVRPQAVEPKMKPGAKPVPPAAQTSASQGSKKSRSRGRGRSSQGLTAHPAPPPPPLPSPNATPPRPSPAPAPPAAPEPRYPAVDIKTKPG